MASAPINVRVGKDVGADAGAEPAREPPRRVVAERTPEEAVDAVEAAAEPVDVESDPDPIPPRRRPTMREIVERAATVAELGSVAAENLGAEAAADTMRRTADVARKGVVAVEGVRREVEPAVTAAKGLWKSMEERGWVGVRKPLDIASMQKRDRPRKSKKEEGDE
jgi:hypothetical protein